MSSLSVRVGHLERRGTADHFIDYWPTREQQIEWTAFRLICAGIDVAAPADHEQQRQISDIVEGVLDVPWRYVRTTPCPQGVIDRLKGNKSDMLTESRIDIEFDAARRLAESCLERSL